MQKIELMADFVDAREYNNWRLNVDEHFQGIKNVWVTDLGITVLYETMMSKVKGRQIEA